MAKTFPVGTIRHWQSGDVIKAHDPVPPFSSGWIPLKTSLELENIGRMCDSLANNILSYKEPINGEKFLDHEINEYGGGGIFRSDEFKVYRGYYGAGQYAFRNEFSRKFMSNEMSLDYKIFSEMMRENEYLGGDKNHDKLTREQKREIRDRVKANWKEEQEPFSPEHAIKLGGIIERTLEQLKEGLNFKDPEKLAAYERFKEIADSLPKEYDRLKNKRKIKNEAIDQLNIDFNDNWGIRESQKDYIEKKFSEFVNKYQDRIKEDDLQDQLEEFDVTIDMDTEEFYNRIFKKINFGSSEDVGFKELMYLRFQTKYGKDVQGDWGKEHLAALKNIEMSLSELPAGHFLNNELLEMITNKTYNGGNHGGYAWYSGTERRINFSADAISQASVYGILSNPTEFKSVLNHEIGHAVSNKLGRNRSYDYKKFVVECGWTYQSQELRMGMTATGSDKDIPRSGSNMHINLITDYSKKAPEEAFAEYYSFYSQNKENIDKWLETGNRAYLKKESKIVWEVQSSERSVGFLMMHRDLPEYGNKDIHTYNLVRNTLSDTVDHNKIELISPWKTKISKEESLNYDVDKIRVRKDYSLDSMPPVISYNDLNGKNVVIDGVTRVEVARLNKKPVPSITISKEFYGKLKEQNFTDTQIADLVYFSNKNEKVPKEASSKIKLEGLIYRDNIISYGQIVENGNILKQMKKIYESDELAKALLDLFGLNKLKELSLKIKQIERV